MIGRAVIVAAVFASLCGPVAARADDIILACVPAPVDTVGLHVEVGDDEVHVPAVSDAVLCVVLWFPREEPSPVELTVYPLCRSLCFRLVVEQGWWTVASTRVSAYLRYEADGVLTTVPLADVPVYVAVNNPNPVCVAVGNPIPECPPDTVAVPVPAP